MSITRVGPPPSSRGFCESLSGSLPAGPRRPAADKTLVRNPAWLPDPGRIQPPHGPHFPANAAPPYETIAGAPRPAARPRHCPRDPLYNPRMHEVIVYSREGCHLCDVVKDTLAQLQPSADFRWREVDIDADPQLCRQYNDQVPVVVIDGRKAFKYHMDARQFLQALAGTP